MSAVQLGERAGGGNRRSRGGVQAASGCWHRQGTEGAETRRRGAARPGLHTELQAGTGAQISWSVSWTTKLLAITPIGKSGIALSHTESRVCV